MDKCISSGFDNRKNIYMYIISFLIWWNIDMVYFCDNLNFKAVDIQSLGIWC